MLKGEALAKAISEAIQRKLDSGAVAAKAEIARHFGIKPPSLNNWEKRGSISKDKLPELFRYFSDVCTPEHWGLTADSDFICSSDSIRISADKNTDVLIPLLANSGAMGDGCDLEDGDIVISQLAIGREWLEEHMPSSKPMNLRFIHGKGDSMAPTFSDGDVLLVDTGLTAADVDGVYAMVSNGRLFIKRVSRRMDGSLVVTSDNPSVKTSETLNGDTDVEIRGRVVWAWNGKRL